MAILLENMSTEMIDNVLWNVKGEGASRLVPAEDCIPYEFLDERNEWRRLVTEIFYKGLKDNPLEAKAGVDDKKALKLFKACLQSFELEHGHKMAACAYILALFFDLKE